MADELKKPRKCKHCHQTVNDIEQADGSFRLMHDVEKGYNGHREIFWFCRTASAEEDDTEAIKAEAWAEGHHAGVYNATSDGTEPHRDCPYKPGK